MPGEITAAVTGQGGTTTTPASTSGASTGVVGPRARPQSPTGPLVVVPAGFIGDIVGSLAGTIGGQVGEWFGDRALGKTLGSAAGPLISHFTPFQILPPSVVAQSAGPGAQSTGNQEAMVVVPSGFLTGLLGGVGGDLIGGALGDLFGNKDLGSQIGSAAGGALGSIFGPFQIVPPALVPASAGPSGAGNDEAMVVVPAGWLGDLFGGIAGGVGQMIGGDTGNVVSTIGAGIGQILPWSALPPQVSPSSTGPDGAATTQELVVVPAGWLSSIASTFAGTIGSGIGGLLGNSQLGQQIGDATAPLIKMIPFSVVPENLQPAAAGPGGLAPEDQLLFVPAGVFGGLLGSFGGLLGSAVGGLFGEADTGKAVGDVVGQLGSLLPFQVLPEGTAA